MTQQPWHQLPADEALAAQKSTTVGLSPEEAARRFAEHGPNRMPKISISCMIYSFYC